jgi:hypothetical protein
MKVRERERGKGKKGVGVEIKAGNEADVRRKKKGIGK